MKTNRPNLWSALAAVAAAGVLAGCNDVNQAVNTSAGTPPPAKEFKPDVDAGVPATVETDPTKIKGLVAAKDFGRRNDPFALMPTERSYEAAQTAERISQENGWSMRYEPPVEPDPSTVNVEEPQPYRRLAGVIVGDTVMAILIMEDGRAEIIRPGMMVPNTEWRVVSIDEEKAILRRAGNRRPHMITIPLETDPGGGVGAPTGGTGGQGGQGGNQGGGNPRGGGGRGRGDL